MANYTSLKAHIIVKFKYRQRISNFLLVNRDWNTVLTKDNPFLMAERRARSCIPFGALSYAPDRWENDVDHLLQYNIATGELKFMCSVKIGNQEIIDTFLENVLPEIAEAWEVVELYEEKYYEYHRWDYEDGLCESEEIGTFSFYDPIVHRYEYQKLRKEPLVYGF